MTQITAIFFGSSPRVMETKIKPKHTYKILDSKGNHKQNEKTTFRMGEKYLQKMLPARDFQNIQTAYTVNIKKKPVGFFSEPN